MGRTLIMGILNVTPDSFSDGGRFLAESSETAPGTSTVGGEVDVASAVAEALRMHAEGADIIDVGGESTRPGSDPTSPEEEQRRILPVLERLFQELEPGPGSNGRPQLSVDTRRASTARAALELAGARAPELIINDVSGLLTEEEMPAVIAEAGAQIVITHNRGDSKTMQSRAEYDDVVAEVVAELKEVRQRYLDAGVPREQIILDPGIGFAKTHEQNWELVRRLGELTRSGHRVLLGASRKGFLRALLDGIRPPDEEPGRDTSGHDAADRDTATAVLSGIAASLGLWAVRVHAVRPNREAVEVLTRLGAESAHCPPAATEPSSAAGFAYVSGPWRDGAR